MATEVKKGAEQASAQEEVKKTGAEASTAKELSAEDIKQLAEALKGALDGLEEEKKLRTKAEEDRDNYKEGMLKAKGKLKSDESEEDEGGDDEKGKTDSKKTDNSSELADIVKTLLKRNQELVTAVVNKSQVATAGQGTGSEAKVEVGDNLLSADQIKDLKARGWDDKKIALFKANLKNARA